MATPIANILSDAARASGDFAPEGRPVTGRKVLLLIVGFFAVVIAVNMTMLYFALSNFSGLVVRNSYVASQNFEQDVARNRAAALNRWRVEASLSRDGVLELAAQDVQGAPVRGAALSGKLGRPSHERLDRLVAFDEVAPGLYRATVDVAPGAWRLRLSDAGAPGVARAFDLYLQPGSSGESAS